ncbi:MAG: hypothetical protein ABI435_09025, partial [Pseudolysinimonas sp.]
TPPPKRGLVPLRPIGFGAVLSAPLRLQRKAPRTTLGPALVVSLITTALAALVQWGLVVIPQAALDSSYYQDYTSVSQYIETLAGIGGWVPIVFALTANALLVGIFVVPAARAIIAERVSFRGLRWRLKGRFGRLLAWTGIVFVVSTGVFVLAALPVLSIGPSILYVGPLFAWFVGFGEAIALILGLGILFARLGFVSEAIALEGLKLRAAIARSWSLSRGASWRLFGQQFLIWLIVGIACVVLAQPVQFLLSLVFPLLFPNGGTQADSAIYDTVSTVVTTMVATVIGAFGLVLQSGVGALLYLDARMRREGLDLALARYVDDRQRGVKVADPFPGGGAA